MNRAKYLAVLAALALGLSACSSTANTSSASPAKSAKRYVVVVKLTGVGWFNRMATGVKQFATDTKIDATQTGAADASPEKQVAIVENLVAQNATAIAVVPNDPASLEGVFAKAKTAGIKIVTHEASSQKNNDADIEAFDNTSYGATIMDNLATCMGNKGKYAAFVGHVTAESHMQWVAGALAEAKAKYPGITRVTDPIESTENADVAYTKTKELLKKYPDLKGIEGSASTDVVGIGRAVEELGLTNKVCVMGTSIPSLANKYLATGAISKIFFWDPALAGQAMLKIADMLVTGKPLTPGMNLGLKGYESVQQSKTVPTTWYGNAWVIVDKSNAAQYPF